MFVVVVHLFNICWYILRVFLWPAFVPRSSSFSHVKFLDASLLRSFSQHKPIIFSLAFLWSTATSTVSVWPASFHHIFSRLFFVYYTRTHRHTAHYGQMWRHPQNRKFYGWRHCNVLQRRQKGPSHDHRECTQNFVKIGPAVPEICSRTYRQTHRQTDELIAIRRSPRAE